MMTKIDYRKELKQLYHPSAKKPDFVDVPSLNFLTVDGGGKPDQQEFQDAASTVYPVAYTLKFLIRKQQGIDYRVMPMEVRWFVNREKQAFKWIMMLMQPEMVTAELYAAAIAAVKAKGEPPLLSRLKFESFAEGLSVQMMHKGPYPKMEETFETMLDFIQAEGYTTNRKMHDIYLNDVRRTRPENLKTVMRLRVVSGD